MSQESPPTEDRKEEFRKLIRLSFTQTGLKEELAPEVIERLVLLDQGSRFNDDSRMVERGIRNVLEDIASAHPDLAAANGLDEGRRRDGRVAALLHDIGRSGPADASPEDQEIVIALFAMKKMGDPREQTVLQAAEGNFKQERTKRISASLVDMGIPPQTTLRHFWDFHALWTRDILESRPQALSQRVRVIAASHHIDRGVDPYNLREADVPFEAALIGALEEYLEVLQSRTLLAADKYQAVLADAGGNHEKAVQLVRDLLDPRSGSDKIVAAASETIDRLGRQGNIFA